MQSYLYYMYYIYIYPVFEEATPVQPHAHSTAAEQRPLSCLAKQLDVAIPYNTIRCQNFDPISKPEKKRIRSPNSNSIRQHHQVPGMPWKQVPFRILYGRSTIAANG